MKLEIGKVYKCDHCRKGTFGFKVTAIDDEWVTGIVASGKANALYSYNVAYKGDELTVRKSFCNFTLLEGK